MPDVRRVEDCFCDAADGEHATAARELARERQAGFDFGALWCAVRRCRAGMSRHDVPEENGVLKLELFERAVDDRRGRLAGRRAADLAFGRERDPRDARAAVAGRLADEQDRSVGAFVEVAIEALGEPLVAVLVEGVADSCGREALYQCSQCTTSSRSRRRCVKRLVARLAFGSGLGLPTVTPATTWTSSGIPSRPLNASRSGTVTP